MFDEQDKAYFTSRAQDERDAAKAATDPAVRNIHTIMAEEYERRAHGGVPRVIQRIVG